MNGMAVQTTVWKGYQKGTYEPLWSYRLIMVATVVALNII